MYGWPPVYFVRNQLFCVCLISISFTCLVEFKPFKQEVSRTVILPSMVSVLWRIYAALKMFMTSTYARFCVMITWQMISLTVDQKVNFFSVPSSLWTILAAKACTTLDHRSRNSASKFGSLSVRFHRDIFLMIPSASANRPTLKSQRGDSGTIQYQGIMTRLTKAIAICKIFKATAEDANE